MPKILITPDVLRSAASTVNSAQSTQADIVREISSLINDIVSDWEGEAQAGFREAFDKVLPLYNQFSPDLSAFAEFLNNYSNTMETLDIGSGTEARNM